MKEIKDNKVLHNEMLNLLHYINDFCVANNIEYSLIYGSLIGAHRHKGIIPWDDDIDIAMTRENYEKFRTLFKENDRYVFFDDRNCKKWFIPFCGCVRDKRFISYDKRSNCFDEVLSLRVDVYPFDYVGNTIEESLTKIETINKYIKKMPFMVSNKRYSKIYFNKNHNLLWNIVFYIPRCFKQEVNLIFKRRFKNKISRLTNEYLTNVAPTRYMTCLWDINDKKIVYKDFFRNGYADVCFEQSLFKAVNDYDYFLTLTYGDWRTEPPLEERVPYHLGCVFELTEGETKKIYEKNHKK